jgi:hypothetical protein
LQEGVDKIGADEMINHSIMLCARDIENMWRNGIPLQKAIRHMQYILAPYEVKAAKMELRKLAKAKQHEYKYYKATCIDKSMHRKKISKGASI